MAVRLNKELDRAPQRDQDRKEERRLVALMAAIIASGRAARNDASGRDAAVEAKEWVELASQIRAATEVG